MPPWSQARLPGVLPWRYEPMCAADPGPASSAQLPALRHRSPHGGQSPSLPHVPGTSGHGDLPGATEASPTSRSLSRYSWLEAKTNRARRQEPARAGAALDKVTRKITSKKMIRSVSLGEPSV